MSQEFRLKIIDETSAFASLLGIPVGITRITAWVKKYKSIIKKKKNKHDKIVF